MINIVSWKESSNGNIISRVLAYTGLNTVVNIVQIFAAPTFFIGIRADGTYIAWGEWGYVS